MKHPECIGCPHCCDCCVNTIGLNVCGNCFMGSGDQFELKDHIAFCPINGEQLVKEMEEI